MNIEDIPNDVLKVMALSILKQPVGKEMYEWVLGVRKTYPQFFPWENIYDSIPDEVHSAYKEELQLLYESFYPPRPKEGKGLWAQMQKAKDSLKDCLDEIYKREQVKRDYEISKKKLWDKYYKKYKLEYRG